MEATRAGRGSPDAGPIACALELAFSSFLSFVSFSSFSSFSPPRNASTPNVSTSHAANTALCRDLAASDPWLEVSFSGGARTPRASPSGHAASRAPRLRASARATRRVSHLLDALWRATHAGSEHRPRSAHDRHIIAPSTRSAVPSASAGISRTRARHAADMEAFSQAFSARPSRSTMTPSGMSARRLPRASDVSQTPFTRTHRPAVMDFGSDQPSATSGTDVAWSVSKSTNARRRDKLRRLRTTPSNVTTVPSETPSEPVASPLMVPPSRRAPTDCRDATRKARESSFPQIFTTTMILIRVVILRRARTT